MWTRRSFLEKTALATGAILTGDALVQQVMAEEATQRLVILHTNDVHSRLEPFPMDGSRNQGLGGVAARAALIGSIRAEGQQVLLLDADDIFQGTPFSIIIRESRRSGQWLRWATTHVPWETMILMRAWRISPTS